MHAGAADFNNIFQMAQLIGNFKFLMAVALVQLMALKKLQARIGDNFIASFVAQHRMLAAEIVQVLVQPGLKLNAELLRKLRAAETLRLLQPLQVLNPFKFIGSAGGGFFMKWKCKVLTVLI